MRYFNTLIIALATTGHLATAAPVPVSGKLAVKACSQGLSLVAGVCSAIALHPATNTPTKFIAGGVGLAATIGASHGVITDYKEEKKAEQKKKELRLGAPRPVGDHKPLLHEIKNFDKKKLQKPTPNPHNGPAPVPMNKKKTPMQQAMHKPVKSVIPPKKNNMSGPKQRVPHAHSEHVV